MRTLHIVASSALLMLLFGHAEACELAAAGERVVVTLKPVVGDEVRMASGFGVRRHPLLNAVRMHTGVDWASRHGAPVVAAARGRVRSAAVEGGSGKIIVIEHGAGTETAYAHLSTMGVQSGDCVAAGQEIGAAGATGLTTATGVHFEVRRNGTPIDPLHAND